MKAVWSFWTPPLKHGFGPGWGSLRDFLLSWILSVETARRHYPRTELLTDSTGARLLVDVLGIPFQRVDTGLDALQGHDPAWWALGKLHAYRAQHEPFVHVDGDVYLWDRLPPALEEADVFAQNPEPFAAGESDWYMPDRFDAEMREAGSAALPREFQWYPGGSDPARYAVCCGILGARRPDVVRGYADLAFRLVETLPRRAGANTAVRVRHMALLEQYYLAAWIEHHRALGAPVKVAYLFSSPEDACARAARLGYTHLIAQAKRNPLLVGRLEARVRDLAPRLYELCISGLAAASSVLGGPA